MKKIPEGVSHHTLPGLLKTAKKTEKSKCKFRFTYEDGVLSEDVI